MSASLNLYFLLHGGFIKRFILLSHLTKHKAATSNINAYKEIFRNFSADVSIERKSFKSDKSFKSFKSKTRLTQRIFNEEENQREKQLEQNFKSLGKNERFGNLSLKGSTVSGDSLYSKRSTIKSDPKAVKSSFALEADFNKFGTLESSSDDLLDHEDFFGDDDEVYGSDEKPHQRLSKYGRHRSPEYYGRKILKLSKKNMIYEAIQVIEEEMLVKDRVAPNAFVFTCLISTLAKVGYTKKAFKVFNMMKQYGVQPKRVTYSSLFTACANCPWPEQGLEHCKHLHQQMHEKQLEIHDITYKCIIKAYALCGDLRAAFTTVDEMMDKKRSIDEDVYLHLLMACASDKQAGFKHAVEVWRRMVRWKKKPTLRHFNLLLRCTRDCGTGDEEYTSQLIGSGSTSYLPQKASTIRQLPAQSLRHYDRSNQVHSGTQVNLPASKSIPILEANSETPSVKAQLDKTLENSRLNTLQDISPTRRSKQIDDRLVFNETQKTFDCSTKNLLCTTRNTANQNWWQEDSSNNAVSKNEPQRLAGEHDPNQTNSILKTVSLLNADLPDALSPSGYQGTSDSGVIGISPLINPEDRLAFLGGLQGVLSRLSEAELSPDVKTLTLLAECMPQGTAAEEALLATATANKVELDTDFFNFIIRRCSKRGDLTAAKNVLSLFHQYKLTPNIKTFGCLAMGCSRRLDGLKLLEDILDFSLVPNNEVFGILMFQAARSFDFFYAQKICEKMRKIEVAPNKKFLKHIEDLRFQTKKHLVDQEHGKQVSEKFQKSRFNKKDYVNFIRFQRTWLQSLELKPDTHPWDKFQQPTVEEDFKAALPSG